ncbi:hypothetical protein RHMOL_Rhmol04G0242100 [Rhododendron molle]|uniref:Uncharacterized protein n=1 Tax=Rhododendron molle TaxID=49168 RepID=A0ACC0P4X9_RHOML|nr:hypothetical protein RHMOL_Rhmol04G0242100 [Rhododendron molle]
MDEEAHLEKNRQVDGDETTRVKVNYDKVQRQLTLDSSGTAVSKELQENQNPDKGSNTGIDLNITPQQKPRIKKHKPKVILEGKPKRTTPETYDKQGISMQMQKKSNNDLPSAPRSPNDSNCGSSSPCLTEEERARGLQRGHSYTTNEAENLYRNMIGSHFSSLDEYLAIFPPSACNNHGSNTGIDLNITPQQKLRRKKHRPIVILEGKPKRTTPKTHDKQETTMQVQKKSNNDLPSAPRSLNDSNCSSSSPCLTEEEIARG